MPDNDVIVLEDARDAVFTLEKEFRRALRNGDLAAASEIRERLEEAVEVFSKARLKLLEAGVMATDDDMAEMRRIKGEIDQAADRQQLIAGAIRFAGFLAKFIV
jgi:adenylosuccinate synthase